MIRYLFVWAAIPWVVQYDHLDLVNRWDPLDLGPVEYQEQHFQVPGKVTTK